MGADQPIAVWRKPRGARAIASLFVGLAALVGLLSLAAILRGSIVAAVLLPEAALIGVAAYSVGLRPLFSVSRQGLHVRNSIRSWSVPWESFRSVDVYFGELLIHADHPINVDAVPAGGRKQHGRSRAQDVAAAVEEISHRLGAGGDVQLDSSRGDIPQEAFTLGSPGSGSLWDRSAFVSEYESRYGPEAAEAAWKGELTRRAMLVPMALMLIALRLPGSDWVWFWVSAVLMSVADLILMFRCSKKFMSLASSNVGWTMTFRYGPPRRRSGYVAWCLKEGHQPYPGRRADLEHA